MSDRAEDARALVRRIWGYDSLRPLQTEAIEAGLTRRDSLVVLPTGGGKSLCYQVPPLLTGRLDVVVSPLISLMKDQVDALRAVGVGAGALHSGLSAGERKAVRLAARAGDLRLLFVSPERLVTESFLDYIEGLGVSAFAIDEAHCISHWGHDFRPEYRQLALLKDRFPGAAVHAVTATATERVRDDIVRQLGLREPTVLVGTFDRPNLVYRVVPRTDASAQTAAILRRHDGEAAIVYCLSRKDTEAVAESLRAAGFRASAYHAGMTKTERDSTQDAFAAEEIDVVVATVAVGMGIDKSDVRCVVHASLPKSVEHYQQETGRAGRDGLPAECVLLYSPADQMKWDGLLARNAAEGEEAEEALAAQRALLQHMSDYGQVLTCRHRFLSRYFGQDYDADDCGACDVCLDEVEAMEDSTVVAQKILSCVARLEQRFGVGYVVQVLRGSDTDTIRNRGHTGLSTYGILADVPEKALTNLVYQLVGQGVLGRTAGDRPILKLTRESVAVLKGELEVKLREPVTKRKVRRTRADEEAWEGVDRGLFEHLREVRRALAAERGVPAYVIFDDRTLRALARERPGTLRQMSGVRGVGEKKLADLGEVFLGEITAYLAGGDRAG